MSCMIMNRRVRVHPARKSFSSGARPLQVFQNRLTTYDNEDGTDYIGQRSIIIRCIVEQSGIDHQRLNDYRTSFCIICMRETSEIKSMLAERAI